MTIRETAIAKIQQLPDSFVQKIIDFIDSITRNHQAKVLNDYLWFPVSAWEPLLEALPPQSLCKLYSNGFHYRFTQPTVQNF